MKQQTPKTIFELIDSENFRKRTAMYIGEKSISNLRIFMDGYSICEHFNNIKPQDTQPPFWLFFHWICKYYKHNGSYYNWDGIILQNCEMDEAKALDTFFERFDEFRAFQPFQLLTCPIDEQAKDHFYSHKGIRWNLIDGKQIRIGPAKDLFIVEYDQSFGSAIYHRNADKIIHSGYFRTTLKAKKDAEREYGKSLKWEKVPNK